MKIKIKKLPTTCEILDLMKSKTGVDTDYQLAKVTGWSRSGISLYRCKPQYFGDCQAIDAAKYCDLTPEFILCCAHAERAKDKEVKECWARIAAILEE